MKKQTMRLSSVMEDYLETIFVLSKNHGYARTGEIARALAISPSSVVEMIGKLSKLKLVEWKRYEGVFLTPEGKMRGEVVHIRHETLRQFFEFIGISPEIANKEACIIEHELSPITTSAIGNLVSFLKTPGGAQAISNLKIFLTYQEAGFSSSFLPSAPLFCPDEKNGIPNESHEMHEDILSVITRHDLLNTIASLDRYLALLKSLISGEETDLVLYRVDSIVRALHRQISGNQNILTIKPSAQWQSLEHLFRNACHLFDLKHISIQSTLVPIEIYGDILLEKALYYLLEGIFIPNSTEVRVVSGYTIQEDHLIWYIERDDVDFSNTWNETTPETDASDLRKTGSFLVSQILYASGMELKEPDISGQRMRFEILIPSSQFREMRMEKKEVSIPYPISGSKNYQPTIPLVR